MVIYQPEDREIYNKLVASFLREETGDILIGRLISSVGKYFLGAPYVAGTLDLKGEESLVVNLRGFDCFTFVENTVAIARMLKAGDSTFEGYAAELKKIRYRRGVINGYSSRLHYFSDWVHDNERKGVVRDITREMGGIRYRKDIDFMTSHPWDYSGLKTGGSHRLMTDIEKILSERPLCYIPKSELKRREDAIESGDVIAVTTTIEGLDVVHVGFACRTGKGLSILHASAHEKMVVVSESSLNDYLFEGEDRSGIMVLRVLQ